MGKLHLIRDKIPKMFFGKKERSKVRAAEDAEFIEALKHSILESAGRLKEAKTENREVDEIVDIVEAINSYMKHNKISVEAVESMRKHKIRKLGGFDNRAVLEE